MLLIENIPDELSGLYRETNESPPEIVLASDLDAHGNIGRSWLIANAEKILVFPGNGQFGNAIHEIQISNLIEVKTISYVGSSAIEVVTKQGEGQQLIQYSIVHADKFGSAAKWLNQRVKGEEPTPVTEEGPTICSRCGMRIPDGSKVCPRCIRPKEVLVRLVEYLRPHQLLIFSIFLGMVVSAGISLVPPYLTKYLIDDVLASQKYGLLLWTILALLVMQLLSTGMSIVNNRISAQLGARITYDIRGQLYEMIQLKSLAFFDKHKIGALISRVTRDTAELHELLAFQIPQLVVIFLKLIGIGGVMLYLDWQLTLLTLLPTPIIIFITRKTWKIFRAMFHTIWHRRAQLSAVLNDSLAGIRVVKGFAQESRQLKRFSDKSTASYQADLRLEVAFAAMWPGLSFIWGLGPLIIWYFGGRSVMAGEHTLGTLMAFIGYLAMFYGPLEFLTRIWTWVTRSISASERIFEILDEPAEVNQEQTVTPLPDINGKVEFRNVTFGYNKYTPVLHDISFTVEPGEMIGFVGHSGAGKTTLTNLICRFYKVDEGQMLIDGEDINSIDLKDLRHQIGIVLQDPFLFDGTIAENIGYAKPGATLEEIILAAQTANAHDFIVNLPDGYDTNVGERGDRLSGGERQRISIARAVLHNPRILILDEATSMVDAETEKKIQEALARLVQGRTTFAIAHRLSTLRNADRLIVLEKGKLVEIGTHTELLKKKGIYHNLVKIQSEMSKMKAVDG